MSDRISATGLKSAEFDEIRVGYITIIDDTGIQVYHKYISFLLTALSR